MRRPNNQSRAAVLLALLLSTPALAASDDPALARDARALLSDRCFACHGPDSGNREAGLRLDLAEAFLSGAGGEHGVVTPGAADQSELYRRVVSADEGLVMPPPESNLTLTAEEVRLLRRWIEAGAPWEDHWSFVPPRAAQPPAEPHAGWGENEIDRFVARRLAEEGLSPSPSADRRLLLRRVTFHLTGLPPTAEELDAFLRDDAPDAYARAVDRLLASRRFGERMAVDWLDAARYADTYGYQNDRPRWVWPWRDWVVDAINQNLPYDDFLTWQLAGDLLPNATPQQRLATAFNRLHRETNEGGSIPREFRAENVADRTNTLGAAVLGLTLECARCHDHKYDPISQRDYYELAAYFNRTGELGLYAHYTAATPTPAMDLPLPGQGPRLADLAERVAAQEAAARKIRDAASLETSTDALGPPAEPPRPAASYSFDSLSDQEKWVLSPRRVDGVRGKAVALNGEDGWTGARHAFERSDRFSLALWIRPGESAQSAVVVHRSQAWLDAAGRGYQVSLIDGRLAAALVHFWPGDAIQVVAQTPLPVDQWTHVMMTYDGSSRADGLRLYVNGRPAPADATHDRLTRTIRYRPGDLMNDDNVKLAVGHRFRDVGFRGGAVDELRVFDEQLTAVEALRLAGADPQTAPPAVRFAHNLQRRYAPYREAVDELRRLRAERDALQDDIYQIAVMGDSPDAGPTHLLVRGAYDAPGPEVAPTPLAEIGAAVPPGEPSRLGLARWLTSPDHPLTARVAVNRIWQSMFGRGLVATANDFGSQGAAPTHPELLDWLARRLINSGWDVKQLVRLIANSAAYRQSSLAGPALLERDPLNELLARGPSGRLPAEMIRDAALASSGLLVDQPGGPPVHPFQPAGLWQEKGAAVYKRDQGAGSHRRSLYTVWKRTSPPPSMMTFDAADREVCVMQRQATATPLQSLVLLNDPQYVEAACALAARVSGREVGREAGREVGESLAAMFRAVTSRRPTDAELRLLAALYEEQLAIYTQHPEQALLVLRVGDLPAPDAAAAPHRAALAMTALAILNHDAAILLR